MLKAASAGTTPPCGTPISVSAEAKPKPWMKPKRKVLRQRLSTSREKKFSTATKMIEAAISASTKVEGSVKILSAASDSVIECEMVKAVTIFTTGQTRVRPENEREQEAQMIVAGDDVLDAGLEELPHQLCGRFHRL